MTTETKVVRRTIPADLVEATPGAGGVGYWLLASPMLLFLGWLWVDLFHHYIGLSATYWVDALLAVVLYIPLVVLPLGYGMHRLVLSLPQLFHYAGWEAQPLEPVAPAEQYLVRYRFQARRWAPTNWQRVSLRAAQGWTFLEIAAILLFAILMIPLYFNAREFGFGQ
jgi:hypothetical protein